MTEYFITPVTAPRMVASDRYKKRPEVLRYRAFQDEVRLRRVEVPSPGKITFYMPMPDSWSQKKRREWNGRPHLQRPDIDNLIKALLDSVFEHDSHIWSITAEKRWSDIPCIRVEAL